MRTIVELYYRSLELTLTRRDIVKKILVKNIPPKPYRCSVRRPALSINGIETIVIKIFFEEKKIIY